MNKTASVSRSPTVSAVNRYRGCLLGLAVGDAVGTAVEHLPRGSFPPVTDMTGGGPFRLPAGCWTDDTSMALCLATSLVECGGFNADDQMKRYRRWGTKGYMSSVGHCFSVGGNTVKALNRYAKEDNPYCGDIDPATASNGSIMRLAPVPMYFAGQRELVSEYSAQSSRVTHAAPEAMASARLLGVILARLLEGKPWEEAIALDATHYRSSSTPLTWYLADRAWRELTYEQLTATRSVIDTLEAALWCVDHAKNYREAILLAVNLGDDADTVGAVTGQLAGARWGLEGIPKEWRLRVCWGDWIVALADRLRTKK